jgi:hypothetical protein
MVTNPQKNTELVVQVLLLRLHGETHVGVRKVIAWRRALCLLPATNRSLKEAGSMKKQLTDQERAKRRKINKYIIGGFVLFVIIIAAASGGNKNKTTSSNVTASTTPSSQTQSSSDQTTKAPATRQVTGKLSILGSGSFTGGKDVAVGMYDVTPGDGQSGNFMVSGSDSYNEILGDAGPAGGVPKVRVQISGGDKIDISGLTNVNFSPVTTPFSTTHTTTNLYTGTFTVGEDIGAGRYVATPGAGQSGNFMVDGSDSYNEILGNAGPAGGVPSLTVNLTNGDVISISGLSQVTLTPSN